MYKVLAINELLIWYKEETQIYVGFSTYIPTYPSLHLLQPIISGEKYNPF